MKILHTNWVAGIYLLILLAGALIPLGMGPATALNNNYVLQVRADYLLHSIFYIPLPLILLLSPLGRRVGGMQVVLFSMVVVVLFETVQMLVPYRAFNINDMFANGVGVILGLGLYALFGARLAKLIASVD